MSDRPSPNTRSVDGAEPLEWIRFLARANSRVRILEHLSEAETATQRDLRTQLDASRTTIARSLQSLEDRHWVERNDGAYRLTRIGAIITDEFSGMLETVQRVAELAEFLRWFPADESTPDFLRLRDAEITSSSDGDPYAPARKQTKILRTADRLRILLPSVDLEGTKTITEETAEHALEAETILSPGLESTFESDEFSPYIREMLESGRSTLFVSERDPPFYLGLADDGRVQIGVEDGEGFPRSLLETTDEDVRTWAEGVYRTYREGARRKPLADFD
ncbi:MAG: helix-turn-helix transcriptional regulator [Halobacteriota archaeon]|uniref:helix-turn-helix transcriptional regulator n=1 Tax=Natronomonas sp. TaxID=2184060 RepID=UPI003976CB5E